MDNIEKQFVQVGDIHLHVVTAGPEDGKPVILLHGFPEFWYGWRHQIPFLAEQGYRVIVPDQRGYNLSDKPSGRNQYTLDILAKDVANLIDAFGYEQASLIGHDWGGVIAWQVAINHAEKLEKLVILNAPYPTVMLEEFMSGNIKQMLRSTYIGFFQLPFFPETVISLNDYATFAQALQGNAKAGAFTEEDMEIYRRAWSQPHAITSMLNYYRGITTPEQFMKVTKKHIIHTPTLMLWGEADDFLGKELAEPSMDYVDHGELVFFPNATHWIQHDMPESVNEELGRFLAQAIAETV